MLLIIGQTAQEYKMAFFCLHRWHMWDLKREKIWKSHTATQQNKFILQQC